MTSHYSAQLEFCFKVQTTLDAYGGPYKASIILDWGDSHGATDFHCDVLLHSRKTGCYQCRHHHYKCSPGLFLHFGLLQKVCIRRFI